jgi:hypothetical protein
MVKEVSRLFVVGFLFVTVTAYAAEQRGQPPRPAVKCVIRDLDVKPGTLHKDARIESFTVDYSCEHGDRRGVDVEIVIEGGPDGRGIIAVLRDITLKEGNHSVSLKGTSKFFGSTGRFIVAFKSSGGIEFQNYVSKLNCLEWGVQNVLRSEQKNCFVRELFTKPAVLKRGTEIQSYQVVYNCKRNESNSDIEIKIGSGSRYDTIAILRDIAFHQGNNSSTLSGTGTFKGEGGNFETVLHGEWGRDTYTTPILCTGWGIK